MAAWLLSSLVACSESGRTLDAGSAEDVDAGGVPTYRIAGNAEGLGGPVWLELSGLDAFVVERDGAFEYPRPLPMGTAFSISVRTSPEGQSCRVEGGKGALTADVDDVRLVCAYEALGIAGNVRGLRGERIVLRSGDEELTVAMNGAFRFDNELPFGSHYEVVVAARPEGIRCAIENGSGTLTEDVGNVLVACESSLYRVGGAVHGLSGEVVLQNRGGDDLTVIGDGAFAFDVPVRHGDPYAVTVIKQPVAQTCEVVQGTGTSLSDVDDVMVSCSAASNRVGGTVEGLSGTLVLRNNGGDDHAITSDGSFAFPAALQHGSAYEVEVASEPPGQHCTVANGTGVATTEVSEVVVTCESRRYEIGGAVSGLGAGQVELQNNGADDLVVSEAGGFTFATLVTHGASYEATVSADPEGATCSVSGGSGIATGDVEDVFVACEKKRYRIGGSVSGLGDQKQVSLSNGVDQVTLAADGEFAFLVLVAHGDTFEVTVNAQPAGQTCQVTGGSGAATSDVVGVAVSCVND